MFGCKFTPGVENAITRSQTMRSIEINVFNSAGYQMVSTLIQLEHADFILVTSYCKIYTFSNYPSCTN